jgi:hypothetical protein
MSDSELLRATFTISPAAISAAEALRKDYDARFSHDPAAILTVAWGYVEGTDPFSGGVVMGFYPRSQAASVAHGIQEVSGVKLIYFTIDKFHPLFDGKVLDHAADRGFFLRDDG